MRICSYTWKNEYALPYESQWGRIAKFCFLNGLSWNHVLHDIKLKNALCADIPRWEYIHIPIAKKPKILAEHGKRIFNVNKMCPDCMKYGFHSPLHETEGMDYCFIHECQLIEIPIEKFYQSEHGTYAFYDVKVENIIRNGDIANKVLEYKQKIFNSKIQSKFISFARDYEYKGIKCYESTERLYQRLVLLQDRIELYGCKQLALLNFNDINEERRIIIESSIHKHINNLIELDYLPYGLCEMNYDDIVNFFIDVYYKRKPGGKYTFDGDGLGLCFIDIISTIIRKTFENLNEWEEYAALVCKIKTEKEFNYLEWERCVEHGCRYDEEEWLNVVHHNKSDIYKFAVIIAYQAITDACSTHFLTEENSLKWGDGKQFTYLRFSLMIRCIMNEPEYIIYPIIEDLLMNIINQAYYMIESGVIKPGYENIMKLTSNIWRIPQYVILNYSDCIEVYRCDPD